MKIILIAIGIIVTVGLGVGLGFLFFGSQEDFGAESSAGPEIDYASDVIGTRVGTTTTGVQFVGGVASSTYRVRTGGADMAIFTVTATLASSTGAHAAFTFYGSNDWDCSTATTSADFGNPILTTDINWYDIGSHVAELAGSQSVSGTSTVKWLPYTGLGKDITLNNLNYQCIQVEATGTSTIMMMQVRLK